MEHLVDKMKPDVQRLERDVLPVIEQMEQAEERWQRLRGLLSEGQRRMMELRGYTPLMEVQRSVLFPDASPSGCSESNEITEHVLEQNIIELAKMEEGGPAEHNLDLFRQDGGQKRAFRQERRRKKRQADTGGLAPDTEEGRSIPRTVALEPFAFDTRLGGVVLEGIYLSPTAFYRELASPEVLTIRALSPIAFYATILSPMVAFARILSPEVFKAQILTPQVLDAFVLSPEAFMAEVLSPLAAEGRVLSPRTLFVQILGPTIGALHIGSPDTHGVLVLSPHILSPRIYSEERYLIEILSPHFLGGEHEHNMEEDTHEHLGGSVRFVGWPEHSPLGEQNSDKHGG
uniref:Uncharacterized protein n=1 Tax=Globodera rostochiensis TaxID=31243 RepID=A0A914HH54_GLORO